MQAINEIKQVVPDAQIEYMTMELSSLSSVRRFADEFISKGYPLHLLINNAGIMNTPYAMTEDGIEAQFQVNHLGHFVLTHHLLPIMISCGGGRVVNLSSRAHMRWQQLLDMAMVTNETQDTYNGWMAYARSKLCNILFSRMLAKKFPYAETKVAFNALHPGLVDTKLLNTAAGLSAQAIPVSDGCKCSLYVATSAEIEGVTGEYFSDSKVEKEEVTRYASDEIEMLKMWETSLQLTDIADEAYGRA